MWSYGSQNGLRPKYWRTVVTQRVGKLSVQRREKTTVGGWFYNLDTLEINEYQNWDILGFQDRLLVFWDLAKVELKWSDRGRSTSSEGKKIRWMNWIADMFYCYKQIFIFIVSFFKIAHKSNTLYIFKTVIKEIIHLSTIWLSKHIDINN